jgi:chromosome segregation ATPase
MILELPKKELNNLSMRISDNSQQILSIQGSNIGVQQTLKDVNSKVENLTKVLNSIKMSLKVVLSRKELRDHVAKMEENTIRMQEVNTGITNAMEELKVSQSSHLYFANLG